MRWQRRSQTAAQTEGQSCCCRIIILLTFQLQSSLIFTFRTTSIPSISLTTSSQTSQRRSPFFLPSQISTSLTIVSPICLHPFLPFRLRRSSLHQLHQEGQEKMFLTRRDQKDVKESQSSGKQFQISNLRDRVEGTRGFDGPSEGKRKRFECTKCRSQHHAQDPNRPLSPCLLSFPSFFDLTTDSM